MGLARGKGEKGRGVFRKGEKGSGFSNGEKEREPKRTEKKHGKETGFAKIAARASARKPPRMVAMRQCALASPGQRADCDQLRQARKRGKLEVERGEQNDQTTRPKLGNGERPFPKSGKG